MRHLIIDTDPGVDDALAILMAFADPAVRVEALTVGAGNVGLQHTLANACRLADFAPYGVPVYAGAKAPLGRPSSDAAYVHGADGFGEAGLPPARTLPRTESAAAAIIRLAAATERSLELICLGPLTNIALALRLDPSVAMAFDRVVVMGGAVNGRGNTSISAEFNIAFDPEAAAIVFESFPALTLVDWEATLAHRLDHAEVDGWLAADDPRAAFYRLISARTREWSKNSRGEGWPVADALAMAVALEPELVRGSTRCGVAIELAGHLTRGMTVVDWLGRGEGPRNTNIVTAVDRAAFRRRVQAALGA